MSAMANRTVLVDNNTWNNTHIATVGESLQVEENQIEEDKISSIKDELSYEGVSHILYSDSQEK